MFVFERRVKKEIVIEGDGEENEEEWVVSGMDGFKGKENVL